MAPGGVFAAHRSIFTYGVAASFIGKDRPYDPATHVFHFNPYNRVQHKSTRNKRVTRPESGQDAFFVSRVGDSGIVALGVADGVGGWMDSGVDPADFSHGLCEYMATAARQAKGSSGASGSPQLSVRQLLQLGYDAVHADPFIVAGGSTAVVGMLRPTGVLEVANLGDSGFIQLRRNAVHAVSDPQTHAFNTPFQLSMIPPGLLARMAAFGGAQLSDEPSDAEVTRHDLLHGDVLVFASDGVWDNLFNQEILHLVSHVMTETGAWHYGAGEAAGVQIAPAAHLQRLTGSSSSSSSSSNTLQSVIATHITAAARAASVNTKRDGPFSKEVNRYYPGETWHGGKVDDICVVVAIACEDAAASDGEPVSEAAIKSRL